MYILTETYKNDEINNEITAPMVPVNFKVNNKLQVLFAFQIPYQFFKALFSFSLLC